MQRDATARYIDRVDVCEETIDALSQVTRAVIRFSRSEANAHRDAIMIARNSLTHMLDTTECK